MKIGLCTPLDAGPSALEAGFDYLECPLTSLEGNRTDKRTEKAIQENYAHPALPVLAFNMFLPGEISITGPELDHELIHGYTERSLIRARAAGAEIIVLGSGRARSFPSGYPQASAEAELCDFLTTAGHIATNLGLIIALEPLRRQESNLINTVAEAAELVGGTECEAVMVLADFFHMQEEKEPLEHLLTYREQLAHVHVADTGRLAPGTGRYPYKRFAELLRKADYNGMVSVECSWQDFSKEGAEAVRFLRQMF